MASIKDNIKTALLDMIAEEHQQCVRRQCTSESSAESFQILAERNFLNKLEEFVKSI